MFRRGTGSNSSEWVNFGSQTHLFDEHKRRVQTVSAWGNGTAHNVHHYGSVTLNVTSPHDADQVERFTAGQYKPIAITLEEVLKDAIRDYAGAGGVRVVVRRCGGFVDVSNVSKRYF